VELKEHFADMLEEQTAELSQTNTSLRAEIDERKKAEAALATSEERYRDLFNNSMDFLYVHDLEGNIEEMSQTWQTLGYSDEELKNLNARDFLAEQTKNKYEDYINSLQRDGWAEGKMRAASKDGREIVLEYRSELVRDNNPHPIVRGTGRDVTERIQAQKEKEELQAHLMRAQRLEAIGTLAGGIAHNFNNILMGIQGNASLGRLETGGMNPVEARLEKIEELVDRGALLTTQLLAYAREGRVQVRRLDLNDIIEETASTFGETRKDIRIRLDLADGLHGVDADAGQIRQTLMNLFINAADAMPTGGVLSIITRNVGSGELVEGAGVSGNSEYVQIQVQDSGVGMDEETLSKVFDPFFTTKSVGQGTGLGLASAYGIVKTHGGGIHVKSELGRGTLFDVYLPAAGTVSRKDERIQMANEKQMKKAILLVDDEQMIIDVGEEMLLKLGYEVFTAGSGSEAIEIYEKRREDIAIVILDMVMPDMGGGMTFDRLKEIDPNVQALLSSGYSIDGEASEILRRGCRGFIQKPFRLSDLSEQLRNIIGNEGSA
jgi:PAS domain S-box-containing protein